MNLAILICSQCNHSGIRHVEGVWGPDGFEDVLGCLVSGCDCAQTPDDLWEAFKSVNL